MGYLAVLNAWKSLIEILVCAAALGQDPYNIDYAERIKGGLHERDGKAGSKPEAAGAATTV